MQPKKDTDTRKSTSSYFDNQSGPEEQGPAHNTCDIKIQMEAQHEAGHYIKVKYDWISVSQGDGQSQITFPQIDTGFFRDWNLLQIEGEEPIPQGEIQIVEPKAKPASFSKKPTGKQQAASKLEEIIDNRA